MVDDDSSIWERGIEATETARGAETKTEFDSLLGIIIDGFVGAVGGLVGTSLLTLVLLSAAQFDAFELASFSILARLTGLTLLFPENTAVVGFVVFVLFGMVPWPLFLASLGWFLPGDRFATRGLPFGFILWTGFAIGFYDGYTGLALAIYLFFTLVGHLAYGFSLGAVFDYLSERPDTLV
jgi:hypothetical protein